MADQSDVENALVAAIGAALYPNGAAALGVVANTVKIYRGWPDSAALRADLAAKVLNVTVFAVPETTQNTTRWAEGTLLAAATTPTLSVTVQGANVTFLGTAGAGQLAGILADGVTFVHRTKAGDTPATVAQALGTLIASKRSATVNGATVSVPGAAMLTARTAADQTVVRWIRSQRQNFQLCCWCPDPLARDTVSAAIDGALAQTHFLALADGTSGWLHFLKTVEFDESATAALFRRDLVYTVDYPTTVRETLPQMLFGATTVAASGGAGGTTLVA